MKPPNNTNSDFRQAIATGQTPTYVQGREVGEEARRFAVYRNNVAHSLKQALARRFPVIERLVGTDFFAAMAGEYLKESPPQSPVLTEWGGDFAEFLEGFPPVAKLAYLGDVAQIEWARGRAYHAADVIPLDPASLTEDPPLKLHPSLRILRSTYPTISIWAANQSGQSGKTNATGAEIALIFRQPDFQVPVHSISESDAVFLEQIMDGQPLATAAGDSDPTKMLTLLIANQLICTPDTQPQN